jgi:hypothetical protein
MKLYATIQSTEGSRTVKKGSNERLDIGIHVGNRIHRLLEVRRHTDGTVYVRYYNDGKCAVVEIIDENKATT